ncbi:MAG: DUF1549 domain-containing protein [Akkermansiaceae bacterium]|nr:DUF1549 domain-containing protein [Akkermansiaceae bacterium]
MTHSPFPFHALMLTWVALTRGLASAEPSEADRLFTLKVGPLLAEKCNGCHGDDAEKIRGEFKTLTREDLLKGGESISDVLVPGDPGKSFLMTSVRWQDPDYEMPPKQNDRLTQEQIGWLEQWIKGGAPWPDEKAQAAIRLAESKKTETSEGVIVATSGGLSDDWTYRRYQPEDLWAFQPVVKPTFKIQHSSLATPRSNAADGVKSDERRVMNEEGAAAMDHILAANLSAAGLKPAPQADPRILIRRASFDLTGLPPTPEETEAFLADWDHDSEKAWESLIDRLLASPHYGERWAQHWFDVVRYADTGGMANDYERSNLWRYRDWVIRAFNDDMPYDRFVREQLAGDELADQAVLKRLGGDEAKLAEIRRTGDYSDEEARMIVATGFLRLGPWDNAMVTDEEARQIYLDDLVNAVGQTFLSTTLRCVKCHDHKFDPIPTRDYYRIYAALAGTQMAERPLRFTSEENRDGFAENRAFVQRMFDFARGEKDKLVAQREEAAKQWYAEHKLPYKDNDARKDDPDESKPPRNVGMDYVAEGQLKVREQDDWIWERALERFEPMVQSVYDGAPGKKAWNAARKLRMPPKIDTAWMPENFIYSGGSLAAPGDEVRPGVLSALGIPARSDQSDPYVIAESVTARRLSLAEWIASPENALTTRSIVNRVWQHHFGKPIAGNPNNCRAKPNPPGTPRLPRRRPRDARMESEATAQAHHDVGCLPDVLITSRRRQAPRDRPEQMICWPFFPSRRLTAEERCATRCCASPGS